VISDKMNKLIQKAQNHLAKNNMSYYEHFVFAFRYGILSIKKGILLCIHSILPCFFENAGNRLVRKLEMVFVERKNEPKSSSKK
jgi:hypothetical protein